MPYLARGWVFRDVSPRDILIAALPWLQLIIAEHTQAVAYLLRPPSHAVFMFLSHLIISSDIKPSLSHTHTHISTFQIYKSTPEGKRTEPGRLTIRPRHRQSITRPFSYLSHYSRGPAAKEEIASAFPIFSQTFIENEIVHKAHFSSYITKS